MSDRELDAQLQQTGVLASLSDDRGSTVLVVALIMGAASLAIFSSSLESLRSQSGVQNQSRQVQDWVDFSQTLDQVWGDTNLCTQTYTQFYNPRIGGGVIKDAVTLFGKYGFEVNANRTLATAKFKGDWSWGSIGSAVCDPAGCIQKAEALTAEPISAGSATRFNLYHGTLVMLGMKRKRLTGAGNIMELGNTYGSDSLPLSKPVSFMTMNLSSGKEVLVSCGPKADFDGLRLCAMQNQFNFLPTDFTFASSDFPSVDVLAATLSNFLSTADNCTNAFGNWSTATLNGLSSIDVSLNLPCGKIASGTAFNNSYSLTSVSVDPIAPAIDPNTGHSIYSTNITLKTSGGATAQVPITIESTVLPGAGEILVRCTSTSSVGSGSIQGFKKF